MPFNLLDAANSIIPDDLVAKAAESSGEPVQGIKKAIAGAIAAVLMGLLNRNIPVGNPSTLTMVSEAAGNNAWSNINSLAGSGSSGGLGSMVQGWLKTLFKDKPGNVVDAIAGFAGIKTSAASIALNMAAPAALGALGHYARENKLSAAGLDSLLQSQRSAIVDSVPSGLKLSGIPGLQGMEGYIKDIPPGQAFEATKKTASAWLWLVTLLIAVLLIWLLSGRSCN